MPEARGTVSSSPSAEDHRRVLRPPPGSHTLPDFDRGWRRAEGGREAYLRYTEADPSVKWSAELERLHLESSRDHFLDRWTRRAIIERLGGLGRHAVIADLGCSTGYLLEDLHRARPDAGLIGVDLIASGLLTAHGLVPEACLVQADICALPLLDASVDVVVSANLLEHIPDDQAALVELSRVLRPGGRAVLVVPAGPSTYDYYDSFLGHERRYGRGELAGKCRRAGLEVAQDIHLGSLLFPQFWLVKQRNRRYYDELADAALEARVATDIAGTRDSRVGQLACQLERGLLSRGVRLPFGIRGLVVARRPRSDR